ncbi:hypothetical protein BOX15_Mlig013339g1 [Macrostomum lignano]|uniref:Transcriptional activator protein Pur-alpha n=2 Tax=Macrostomum lignano TaxID=282301 RepID=A0A267EH19_9PLAT|nr:hypothetical protein BOX15_Mlig013339g1 [Macrostomum lignano]
MAQMANNRQRQQQQRGADSDEQEIASRTVQVQSKRFYLDVKQNRRGRFLKIAEVGSNGQKSRILMSMSSTTEFRDKLSELVKFYKQLEAGGATGDHGNGPRFKSESMVKDNRRYYLDLKENQRGKFLRVAQQVPQTGMRSQIAMPAEGMSELKEKLTELIEECGTDDLGDGVEQLPGPKSFRAMGKIFYFDVGANRRGTFLRVSEVHASYRTAVTVPDKCWANMRDILNELIENDSKQPAAPEAAKN